METFDENFSQGISAEGEINANDESPGVSAGSENAGDSGTGESTSGTGKNSGTSSGRTEKASGRTPHITAAGSWGGYAVEGEVPTGTAVENTDAGSDGVSSPEDSDAGDTIETGGNITGLYSEGTRPYQDLYDTMEAYNLKLAEDGQQIVDAWSYEQEPFDLSSWPVLGDTPTIGYIDIPDMKVVLPLFLGASTDNLEKGAAVLSQTSMPIGGNNTNCVIAGHRGWEGSAYFQYVENMKLGSRVYITNPWETLVYECTEIQITYPDDVDSVLIRPGKDLITLFTCHPYVLGGGPYRYLVFCERVDTQARRKATDMKNPQTEEPEETATEPDVVGVVASTYTTPQITYVPREASPQHSPDLHVETDSPDVSVSSSGTGNSGEDPGTGNETTGSVTSGQATENGAGTEQSGMPPITAPPEYEGSDTDLLVLESKLRTALPAVVILIGVLLLLLRPRKKKKKRSQSSKKRTKTRR